jgi:hypothetical protein
LMVLETLIQMYSQKEEKDIIYVKEYDVLL